MHARLLGDGQGTPVECCCVKLKLSLEMVLECRECSELFEVDILHAWFVPVPAGSRSSRACKPGRPYASVDASGREVLSSHVVAAELGDQRRFVVRGNLQGGKWQSKRDEHGGWGQRAAGTLAAEYDATDAAISPMSPPPL